MKIRVSSLTALALLLVATGCQSPTNSNDDSKDPGSKPTPTVPGPAGSVGGLKFNLTGAKAVGAADIGASGAIRGLKDRASIRAALSRAATVAEYGLIKVLDDGSVQMAMSLPEGVFMPKVMFIAKSPVAGSKDLYLAFESNISYNDPTTNQQVQLGSFLHVLEDGTFYSVITKDNGRVKNYSWYGNDNYKPVSFDSSGNLYYVFESWGSTQVNQLFKYDPVAHVSTPITPALSGMQYNNFEVSSDGTRLFVQGSRNSGGGTSNFFRMYPLTNIESPVSIYYSSGSNIWVRGYKVSPAGVANQSVILNGWGIRGINGLLRANVLSDTKITYEPLFDSNVSSYFSPTYNEWYSDWEAKTYYDGFFDQYNYSDMYLVMTDKTDFYYLSLSTLLYSNYSANVSVIKNPLATDWFARGDTTKTIVKDGFGFASDLSDPSKIITSDVETNAVELYDDVKAKTPAPLALRFVRRWTNGSETMVKSSIDLKLVNKVKTDVANYGTFYQWNPHWYKNGDVAQGLDTAAILAYAGKYFMEDVLFKIPGSVAGDESFAAFAALNEGVYTRAQIDGATGENFLSSHFVKASDGVTPAITAKKYKEDNNLQWLNFQNVSSVFYDSTGACWAIVGGNGTGSSTARPVRILDPAGKKTLGFIPALNGKTYNPVSYLFSGNRMFFRDGLPDVDGFESGYHKLYLVDVTAEAPIPTDMLVNVPENGTIEIVSFSVSGDTLYFTGVKGTGVIGGKIDIVTKAYTPLDGTYLVRNIEVY